MQTVECILSSRDVGLPRFYAHAAMLHAASLLWSVAGLLIGLVLHARQATVLQSTKTYTPGPITHRPNARLYPRLFLLRRRLCYTETVATVGDCT